MLIRHSSAYLLGRLLSAFINIGGLWAFSRLFAPDVFGAYITITAYAAFLQLALFQWLRVTLLRFVAQHSEPAILRGNILTLFLLMLGTLSLVGVGLHMALPELRLYILPVLLTSFCIAWNELCLDDQRARLKPRTYVALSLARDGLFLLLALLLERAGYGLWALVCAFLAANILPTLPMLPTSLKDIGPLRLRADILKSIFSYGLPMAPVIALSALVNNIDRLLLPLLLGTHFAGLYAPAHSAARQGVSMLMQAVNLAAFPLAIRALHTSVEAAQTQLRHNLLLLLAIGLPALVGLAVLAPAFAHTLFGPDYAPAAQHLLPWLSLVWFFHSLRIYYTEQAFQLGHNTKPALRVGAISASVAVVVALFSLLQFGFAGAAYGAVSGAVLALLCSWYFGRRIFPLPFPLRDMARVAMAALIMGAVLWPQRAQSGFVPLGLAVASGIATYGVACLCLNVLGARRFVLGQRNPR